jgi:hypothetical protein
MLLLVTWWESLEIIPEVFSRTVRKHYKSYDCPSQLSYFFHFHKFLDINEFRL